MSTAKQTLPPPTSPTTVVIPFIDSPTYALDAMALSAALKNSEQTQCADIEIVFVLVRLKSIRRSLRRLKAKLQIKRSGIWKMLSPSIKYVDLDPTTTSRLDESMLTANSWREIANFPTNTRPLVAGPVNSQATFQRLIRGESLRLHIHGRLVVARLDKITCMNRVADTLVAGRFALEQLAKSAQYLLGNNGQQKWRIGLVSVHFRDVHVGDLICSSALSRHSGHSGQLRPWLRLFALAFSAARLVLHSQRLRKLAPHYVTAPERTYVDWVIPRTLARFGATVVSEKESFQIQAVDPNLHPNSGPLPWYRLSVIASRSDSPVSSEANISAWMEARTGTRGAVTRAGTIQTTELSLTARRQLDVISSTEFDRLHVIFLHDFSDAQLNYGVEEFIDLYTWADFSIQESAAIDGCLTIVKGHPAALINPKAVNLSATARLQKKFAGESVHFLDSTTLLADLLTRFSKEAFVGITHHGSVAEELVWNDIAVIASRVAIWGKDFLFCPTWESAVEYQRLLRTPVAELRSAASLTTLKTYLQVRRGFDPLPRSGSVTAQELQLLAGDLHPVFQSLLVRDFLLNAGDDEIEDIFKQLQPDLWISEEIRA